MVDSIKRFGKIDKDSNDIVSVIQKAMDIVWEFYQSHNCRIKFPKPNW